MAVSGPAVAHLGTAVAIVGGGMLAGHVIAPYAPGAHVARRALFALIMLVLGAWRGRSERRAWGDWNGAVTSNAQVTRFAALGSVSALAVAAAGYWVAHG